MYHCIYLPFSPILCRAYGSRNKRVTAVVLWLVSLSNSFWSTSAGLRHDKRMTCLSMWRNQLQTIGDLGYQWSTRGQLDWMMTDRVNWYAPFSTSWDFLGLTSCESMRILWLLMLLSLLSIYLNLITVYYCMIYMFLSSVFHVFPSEKVQLWIWQDMTRQPCGPCVQEIMKTDGVEWTMMFKACILWSFRHETWIAGTPPWLVDTGGLEHDFYDFPY